MISQSGRELFEGLLMTVMYNYHEAVMKVLKVQHWQQKPATLVSTNSTKFPVYTTY